MTGKIKRRSLRCGGRPKADFGSLFTSVIAPTLNAAGSIADESIDKHKTTNSVVNNNTIIPPDPTKTPTMRLGGRKKCWIGAAIGAATSIAGSLFGAAAQKREMRRQKSIQDWQTKTQEAANMSAALNNSQDYQEDYLRQFRTAARLGKTLGAKSIYITDGGDATKIDNNTYLLRGGSHEDVNETGQTGIGINVGGNEVEAEGGEVAQKKNGALRIFSAQPILGNGMSPAQAVMSGASKDKVFSAQQQFKKRNGLKDDGSKAAFGNLFTIPFSDTARKLVEYFSGTGRYASKPVKVTPKTVAKKPIRNGQVGNFRIVNGKRIPNEKPLRRVYPEFDVISIGRGLPIKRSLKNTIGFVSKPNTFTRGIGGREGIKDLVESKVVRGNPVGTEMTAKAYSKATKSNRNNFNDIMNGTGRKDISHRYYNRSLSKEDFDAIQESYNKINTSFKARHPKASGKIRFAIGDDVYDPLGNYKNYDDYLAQIASDRKSLRNATTINPDNGEPIAYFYNDGRNPLTQGHGYASSKWGVRISNPQDYNMKIFDGHLHYSNSKTIPFDSPNVEVFRSTPLGTIRYPKWMLRRGWYRNGGLTSKDRGSSKHPYPSVSSKDFAGGGRSYPIPTKADAVDALRLAGLHGRSDIKAKVYSRYPELRKKAEIGTWVKPVYNTSKYRGTSRARTQIAKWEGSDFAGQNAQFKGDAIGAKERELRQFMSKAYNYLNDNQRDALLSYYYNIVPKTFRGQMTKYRNALINAQTEQEYNDTLNNMRESINVGANRKGMRGLRNRRAVERNWFGYTYTNPVQEKIDKTLIQVPDATTVVQQPTISKPIEVNPQEGYVPSDTPQGYNIPQGRLYDFIKNNMKRQLRYGGRAKADLGTERIYNLGTAPKPRSKADEYNFPLLDIYHALIDRFDDKNPYLRYNAGKYNQYSTAKETDAKKEQLNRIIGARRTAKALGGYSRPVKGVRHKAKLGWLGYPYPLPRKWDFTNIKLGDYKPSVLSKNYPYARGMDDEAKRLESTDNYRDFSLYRTQLDENNPYVQALTKATGHSWNDIKADNYKLRYDSKLGYNHFTPEVKEDKYGIWGEPIEQKTWLDNDNTEIKGPYNPQKIINSSIDTKKTIPVDTKKTTEYDIRDNKFGMTPSTGDWIGLGVDTLTGLAGGIINYNAANDMYIPGRAPIMLASKLPTNYNITPQVEEVKRMRDRLSGETYRNTSSSVAALNRGGNINLNALNELSKLWATKENEENKMLTQDALNQQSVAETNVRNQMARESEIAQYKNAQHQAKYDAINASLTGLAQAYNNFYTNATKRYEDEIAMRTYLAGSEAATPYRMLSMGVPMSTRSRIGLLNQVGSITNPGPRPERKDYDSNASWSRAIDKWEKDNTLYKQRGQYKNMILRGISSKAKRKYGIG